MTRAAIVTLVVLLAGSANAENIQKRTVFYPNPPPCYGCGSALQTFHVQPQPEPEATRPATGYNARASHTGGTND